MKTISMRLLNTIKKYDAEIFEAEDSSIPDRKVASRIDKKRYNLLKDYSQEEKQELLTNIKWYYDNCNEKLKELGWTITIEVLNDR